jgi:hypothetical protein
MRWKWKVGDMTEKLFKKSRKYQPAICEVGELKIGVGFALAVLP